MRRETDGLESRIQNAVKGTEGPNWVKRNSWEVALLTHTEMAGFIALVTIQSIAIATAANTNPDVPLIISIPFALLISFAATALVFSIGHWLIHRK